MGYSEFEEGIFTMFQPEEDCSPIPERPGCRSRCAQGVRPCPFVTCRYHLITMFTRTFWRAHSDDQIVEFVVSGMNGQSCALDMATARESTFDEIAYQTGQTRENIRQLVDGVFYSENRCMLSGWKNGMIHRPGAIRHARILCAIMDLDVSDVKEPVYINASGTTHKKHAYRAA